MKSSTTLEPALADIRTVSAPKPLDSSKSKQVTANVSKVSGRQTRSPQKDKLKQCSDRVPKGARDPVALRNKFGALEEMGITPSTSPTRVRSLSPKRYKGKLSPITHSKHKK